MHRPEFLTHSSRWLIAVGVIGALLAATVGFLDLRPVRNAGVPAGIAKTTFRHVQDPARCPGRRGRHHDLHPPRILRSDARSRGEFLALTGAAH
ncbi:hypothetical protein [Streptomyces sp. 1222.5]|uniref:hypothetical protein n=1 Tax=Streptomyces sp. 1222.5 TaxID=1881026 RepID=UPI003D70D841